MNVLARVKIAPFEAKERSSRLVGSHNNVRDIPKLETLTKLSNGTKIDGNEVHMVAVKEVVLSGAGVTVCDIGTLDLLPIPLSLSPLIDDNSLSSTIAEDSTAIRKYVPWRKKRAILCGYSHFVPTDIFSSTSTSKSTSRSSVYRSLPCKNIQFFSIQHYYFNHGERNFT
jgi:hypothetical protein